MFMSDTVFANTKAGNAAMLSGPSTLHCITNRAETRPCSHACTRAHTRLGQTLRMHPLPTNPPSFPPLRPSPVVVAPLVPRPPRHQALLKRFAATTLHTRPSLFRFRVRLRPTEFPQTRQCRAPIIVCARRAVLPLTGNPDFHPGAPRTPTVTETRRYFCGTRDATDATDANHYEILPSKWRTLVLLIRDSRIPGGREVKLRSHYSRIN